MAISKDTGLNVQIECHCTLLDITGIWFVHLLYTTESLKQSKTGHISPLFKVY